VGILHNEKAIALSMYLPTYKLTQINIHINNGVNGMLVA